MIAETIRERMAQTIKYVKPVPYASATGLTADVYQQMQADFLPVPPLTLHSPVPQLMAGVWSVLRETLRTGQVDRALKEAVAAAVSKMNACPYCVDVHTSMLHATASLCSYATGTRYVLKGVRSMQRLTHFVRARHGQMATASAPQTHGLVITSAWRYDLILWLGNLITRGKWQALRQMTADLAQLQVGEKVLDVGCGTGLVAHRLQARGYDVVAIDESAELVQHTPVLGVDAQRAPWSSFADTPVDVVLFAWLPSTTIVSSLSASTAPFQIAFAMVSLVHQQRKRCGRGSPDSHEATADRVLP